MYSLHLPQSISAPGSGIWSDGKDKSDGSQAHTWNVEVLIDVVKEVVSYSGITCYSPSVGHSCLALCTENVFYILEPQSEL